MSLPQQQSYKYCVVPKCLSTTISTPKKKFVRVPVDVNLRKQWFKVMRRDQMSPKTRAYCCEDHFDIETDMENYVKYKLVGGRLFLKKAVVPHKLACQERQPEKTKRIPFKKRQRRKLMNKVPVEDSPSVAYDVESLATLATETSAKSDRNAFATAESREKNRDSTTMINNNSEKRPRKCCYCNCAGNSSNTKVFSFPVKEESQKKAWIDATGNKKLLNLDDRQLKRRYVCSKHFMNSDFMDPKVKIRLTPSAIPTRYDETKCFQTSGGGGGPPGASDRESRERSPSVTSYDETKCFLTYGGGGGGGGWPPGASDRQSGERSPSEQVKDEHSATEKSAHYTSHHESQNGKLRLSSDVLIPESTNITLDQELLIDLHELSDKIQNFYPVLAGRQFTLCFKGKDGDKCEYIFTSASDTRRKGERHSGSRCGECEANIIGFRYKCVTCADYDLCSACEALGIHAQHVMMRIAKPLKSKQARVMVQRCCDVMEAGVLSAMLDKFAGNTSCVDTVNSSVDKIVEASTNEDEEASLNKSKTAQTRRSTKELFVKNLVPSKAKASTTTDGADDKQKKTNEHRKRKAEASEDEEEMKPTVKEEPDDTDLASCYNSFTDTVSEPLVVTEEVKLEDPDPLETEKTIKVEQPTSARTSSWSADNYTEPAAAAAGSSDTSRPEEDTASVCLTYTHKRTKKSSDLNS